jgi:hypothetical protein
MSDIPKPGLHRGGRLEILIQQISCNRQRVPGIRCGFEFTPLQAAQPQLATDPFYPVNPYHYPVIQQVPL